MYDLANRRVDPQTCRMLANLKVIACGIAVLEVALGKL